MTISLQLRFAPSKSEVGGFRWTGSPSAAGRPKLGLMAEPVERPAADVLRGPALSRAIEQLIQQFAGTLAQAARRYGITGAELDDVVQDVRLRLWKLLERSNESQTTINASYAYRAASSAAIDIVRRDRTRRSHEVAELDESFGANPGDMTDALARLEEALTALSPARRSAVRLHLDGRSLAEIARVLQWTEAQARNQVYRGLADLKQHLTSEDR